MKTHKLVQYGFFISIFLSVVFLFQFSNPTRLHGLRYEGRFHTAMRLHQQFKNLIDDSEPPTIGILTQGTTDMQYYDNHTMIAASYIRYIEAAGGKVVAVPYNLNETDLERIYQNINGLLIPGGRMKLVLPVNKTDNSTDRPLKLSMFARAAKFFVDKSIEDFHKGVYFPIFGICLGQEAIALALNLDLRNTLTFLNLTENTYQDHAGPYNPEVKESYKSRIFKTFTEEELVAFEKKAKFFYHHKYGVTEETYLKSEVLRRMMIPLTTLIDNSNNKYITSFELYNYPMFGVQFHPEKSSFEWNIKTDRSPETITITHKLGANFISECRKNSHTIVDPDLVKNLTVYKHLIMGPKNGYSQLFYFNKEKIKEIINYNNQTNITDLSANMTEIQAGNDTVQLTESLESQSQTESSQDISQLSTLVIESSTIPPTEDYGQIQVESNTNTVQLTIPLEDQPQVLTEISPQDTLLSSSPAIQLDTNSLTEGKAQIQVESQAKTSDISLQDLMNFPLPLMETYTNPTVEDDAKIQLNDQAEIFSQDSMQFSFPMLEQPITSTEPEPEVVSPVVQKTETQDLIYKYLQNSGFKSMEPSSLLLENRPYISQSHIVVESRSEPPQQSQTRFHIHESL